MFVLQLSGCCRGHIVQKIFGLFRPIKINTTLFVECIKQHYEETRDVVDHQIKTRSAMFGSYEEDGRSGMVSN